MNIGIYKIGANTDIGIDMTNSGSSEIMTLIRHLVSIDVDVNYYILNDIDSSFTTKQISKNIYEININNIDLSKLNLNKIILNNGSLILELSNRKNCYDKLISFINNNNVDIFLFFEDIFLSRFFNIELNNKNIKLISQFYNIDLVKNVIEKDNNIIISKVYYFPIEKFVPFSRDYYNFLINKKDKNIKYDVYYAGSGSKKMRIKKLDNLLIDDCSNVIRGSFNNNMFKNIHPTIYNNKISFEQVFYELYNSFATIILTDYESFNFKKDIYTISSRLYQCYLTDTITFMDDTFDIKNLIKLNLKIKEFLIIKDKNDLYKKIKLLKENVNLYKDILKEQQSIINNLIFNKNKFFIEFYNILING